MTSEEKTIPTDVDIEFMRSIEAEFKAATGLMDRSQFKIFYSPVWKAKVVLLGINPAGAPDKIAPDGARNLDGSNNRSASSISFYEEGQNDLVDCAWPENRGLLKLLLPLLGSSDNIRRNVVKTNLGFARSKDTKSRKFIEATKNATTPFLRRILDRVEPELVLLAGVRLNDFTKRHCATVVEITERKVEQSVNQTVIWPANVRLLGGHTCIAVEVAHASQFSWLYTKHDLASQIKALMTNPRKSPRAA